MARILIVDDNEATAKLHSIFVEAYGHDAQVAYDGYDAIDMIASDPPDIVLLDMMMPGIDGFETLELIRSMPHGRDLPVIMISARADEDLEQRVASSGGNGFLRKPFGMQVLADALPVPAYA